MGPTIHAPSPLRSLAVTYRCSAGHHDIRFYGAGHPVARMVLCSICFCPSEITVKELNRHARLRDTLKEQLTR
jgi:hypothetical protein